MEGEQFSLCWNNFHSNLSSGFHALLKEEDLVDVTLAAEGRFLKAHKTVLSVCSPFFKELFRANPCKHPIVVLQDVKYGALCSLLQFMYQGEVSVSQEEIPTFMRVAETLKVKGLTESTASSETNGNGFENKKTFGLPDTREFMKRPRPVKKVIKPIQHLRPIENASNSVKSPQPPLKKPHLDEPVNVPSPQPQAILPKPQAPQAQTQSNLPSVIDYTPPLITPKLEPIDAADDNSSDQFMDDRFDMASLLDTKIVEPSPSSQSSSGWTPDTGNMQDSSTPGMVIMKSGKGQVVLIYGGHIYTLQSGGSLSERREKSTTDTWICVKKHTLNCKGRITTLNGPLFISSVPHNHSQLNEVINKLQTTNST